MIGDNILGEVDGTKRQEVSQTALTPFTALMEQPKVSEAESETLKQNF